ncbi:hypothetical protein, partial [Amycolatopsis rhizosphaerae]|uniref:hypothetical protein n=1 Tax=Amycolatopsis rhizosphaerae TaxID=2053003 RepID=UPI001C96CA1A
MMPLLDLQPLLWPLFVLLWVVLSMYSRAALHRRWHAHSRSAPNRPPYPTSAPASPPPRKSL